MKICWQNTQDRFVILFHHVIPGKHEKFELKGREILDCGSRLRCHQNKFMEALARNDVQNESCSHSKTFLSFRASERIGLSWCWSIKDWSILIWRLARPGIYLRWDCGSRLRCPETNSCKHSPAMTAQNESCSHSKTFLSFRASETIGLSWCCWLKDWSILIWRLARPGIYLRWDCGSR